MTEALLRTELPGLPEPRRGKVRDIYDLGDELLIVACDRISAYDSVLSPGIPGKGKILTQLSNFWFDRLSNLVPNALLASKVEEFPSQLQAHREVLEGRSVWVRKARVIPFECVARGYLAGSGFGEYQRHGAVCGVALPPGLLRAERLEQPIFTPATKADNGHDENVSAEEMARQLGVETTRRLAALTLSLYQAGRIHAEAQGLLLADTKFEFGRLDGEIHLIDEALTPDSSRYWQQDGWMPGTEPLSFDKQFVRNWLDDSGWDRHSPPPELPAEVVEETLALYTEAFRRLTGTQPDL